MPSTTDARTSEQRTVAALAQSAFERDRMIAWYAAEVQNARWLHSRDSALIEAREREIEAQEREIEDLQAVVGALQAQVAGLLGSTSWRVTLPLRVLRRPKRYLARLVGR